MKKYFYLLFVVLFAAVSFTLISCSESPIDKALAIMDENIEKIEKANDVYELIGIANTMKSDLNAIDAANKDYKPTDREAQKIKEKLNEVQRIYLNKAMELSYGDTPEGKAAKDVLNKMLPQ